MLARKRAIEYYKKQKRDIENKGELYGKPFASPGDFKMGENAAYSVTIFFVITSQKGETDMGIISGQGHKEATLDEIAREIVTLILLGYAPKEIPPLLSDGITARELQDEVNTRLSAIREWECNDISFESDDDK